MNLERREKDTIQRALSISQKSTASMGKFDKVHKDEPKIKSAPKVTSIFLQT